MQKLGVLTSGGDAPGMNAAIRAVVRKAIYHNVDVVGIRRGFYGLIHGDFVDMEIGSVADIIHRGGTILRTSRAPEFLQKSVQEKAIANIRGNHLDGLVIIGGDGSLHGAAVLSAAGIRTVGVPGTIDNDIAGTDYSIGYDTALNNVVDAINKIRDTATSHERVYVIEVMGRESGFIALSAGLAGGAESIFVPEIPFDINEVCERLQRGVSRGKLHSIILVAEGAAGALEIGEQIKERTNSEVRITILGHLQRGGSPTARDRMMASRLGAEAVDLLLAGDDGKMVGLIWGKLKATPYAEIFKQKKSFPWEIYELATVLAI
jgi:6-phosphofructokinase 1